MLRIGLGSDLHCREEGRPLVLGGVHLPCEWGLKGHSDADALLHAVIDAILGALALGDIGGWFPDTDPRWKGADSRQLLKTVLDDPRVKEWQIVNVDSIITTEKPKLAPHIMDIRRSLAACLEIPPEQVSVKAKTNEKQDAIGAGLALAVQAIVLLEKRSPVS